jgi:DNA-binding NarL/FixJ family response regulator
MPVRIFVADDHEVVREGVKSLLKMRPDWAICGEAANGPDTVSGVQNSHPDALVLDLSMPGLNGLEVAREISARAEQTKILVFTMHDSTILAQEARKAGARGVVHKSLAGRDLVRALEIILGGGTFFESGDSEQTKPEKNSPSKLVSFLKSTQSISDWVSLTSMSMVSSYF